MRPLHVVLSRDAHEITATRWAEGALLNGKAFTRSDLKLGDELSIGDVVVTLGAAAVATAQGNDVPNEDETDPRQSSDSASISREERHSHASSTDVRGASTEIHRPFQAPFPTESMATNFSDAMQRPSSNRRLPTGPTNSERETNPADSAKVAAARHAFADRTLMRLWTANSVARIRCRRLLRVVRESRRRAANLEDQVEELAVGSRRRRDEWNAEHEARLAAERALATAESNRDHEACQLADQRLRLQQQLDDAHDFLRVQTGEFEKLQQQHESIRSQVEEHRNEASQERRRREEIELVVADQALRLEDLIGELERLRRQFAEAEEAAERLVAELQERDQLLEQSELKV
ncbi:MAG: hypothetical protein AAF961_19150, partial [Planctomycetota bacterium]